MKSSKDDDGIHLSSIEKEEAWEEFETQLKIALETENFSAERLWLTFGISAVHGFKTDQVEALRGLGLSNLQGWPGATVYAKLPVDSSTSEIRRNTINVFEYCDHEGLELFEVSLDTHFEVKVSKFHLLTRFISYAQTH